MHRRHRPEWLGKIHAARNSCRSRKTRHRRRRRPQGHPAELRHANFRIRRRRHGSLRRRKIHAGRRTCRRPNGRSHSRKLSAAPASPIAKPWLPRLSGGWRKRLAIAEALVQHPDILAARRAHQPSGSRRNQMARRVAAKRVVCLRRRQPRPLFPRKCRHRNGRTERLYADGFLRVDGNYSTFLEAKELISTRSEKNRKRWPIASTPKSNGCAADPRPAPPNPKRASTKPTK